MLLDWVKANSALQLVVGVEVAFLLVTTPYFDGVFSNAGWAAVTVCVVMSPNVGEGLKKWHVAQLDATERLLTELPLGVSVG